MTKEATPLKTNSSQEDSFAFFLLDNQEFGIKVEHVRETILHKHEFTRMPCSMDALDGLINLRGSIIPIINLRSRFHLNAIQRTPESPIAIVQFNRGLFGLLFDEISEVIRVKQSEICLVETAEEDPELCNQGVISLDGGDRIVQLLDLERLFKKYNLPRINNETFQSQQVFIPRKQDITFMLNGQEYAIAVDAIREIMKPPAIKRKILVHPAIKGVIELRGKLINIVDLRNYFNFPAEGILPESRIIILQGDLNCGILVDAIKEVIQYDEDLLLAVPVLQKSQDHISGIVALEDGRNIIKLDTEHLFDNKLIQQLQGNMKLHAEDLNSGEDVKHQEGGNSSEIKDKVLISFRLDNNYAFDITLFREIINYSAAIVPLPGQQHYQEGLLNLRNSAIPIINLRKYYAMDNHTNVNEAKIIILNLPEKTIGIMVDEIIEIVKPARMDVERIPQLSHDAKGKTANHVREGYRLKTTSGEEKSLLIYDVEQFIRDIEVPAGNIDVPAGENGCLRSMSL
ncbi:chemotaxis protein CheW [uncultured Desulfuromusa sp.]|uniref:chemotaxis protein CheW n=1 Tax=uncultured Desulfuromusa sp. TaxID=219183 RepID=UPI002AA62642|nr:chemotaxis protein CheW [uncultured Desulfuromusa sp.]